MPSQASLWIYRESFTVPVSGSIYAKYLCTMQAMVLGAQVYLGFGKLHAVTDCGNTQQMLAVASLGQEIPTGLSMFLC